MGRLKFINNFETTLSSPVDNQASTTSIFVTNASPLGALENGDYYFMVLKKPSDYEVIKVTGVNAGTGELTIEREQEGTSAIACPAGTLVSVTTTSGLMEQMLQVSDQTGFKNKIINGACAIAQRGDTTISDNAGHYGSVDRFEVSVNFTSVGQFILGQNTVFDAMGFQNALRVRPDGGTATGGAEELIILQKIESANAAPLKDGPAHCRIIVKHALGSAKNFTLKVSSIATKDDFSSAKTVIASTTVSVANDSATQLELPIANMGDCSKGIEFRLTVDIAEPWDGGTSEYVDVTGAQLEPGSKATSFEYRPVQQELALCQRYFEKSYPIDSAPGATDVADHAPRTIWNPGNIGGGRAEYGFELRADFKVTKRNTPSVVWYSPITGAANAIYNITGAGDITSISGINSAISHTGSPYKSGGVYMDEVYGHWAADSEF